VFGPVQGLQLQACLPTPLSPQFIVLSHQASLSMHYHCTVPCYVCVSNAYSMQSSSPCACLREQLAFTCTVRNHVQSRAACDLALGNFEDAIANLELAEREASGNSRLFECMQPIH
jgi:hypothetical protein